jgi:molecular chaperone DnaJ
VDFYVLLGVERRASVTEIKRAYRHLARRFHPDINPGDEAAAVYFRQIVEAYETLVDPTRRHAYDVHGPEQDRPAASSVAFEGFDFSRAAEGHAASTFSELFADVFRGADASAEAGRPQPGADLHGEVAVAFDEAMRGCERQLSVTRQAICTRCHGAGELRTTEGRCPHCQGSGALRWARGHMVFSKSCAACCGTGRQQRQACPACAGVGVTARAEAVTLRVPPGVADGARVRVPEKGHAGRQGGRPGDLYINVHVGTHPFFERDGDDLHLLVPVAVHEAALGAKIEVPTIDGPARLRIPPGTQSGQRFRLHGQGAPSPRGGQPGDLVVEVRLVLPRTLDERSKELMREFGVRNRDNVRRDLGVEK